MNTLTAFGIWYMFQAKPLIEKDEIKELVDPVLGDSYDHEQLKQLTEVATLCIQQSSMLRPRISEVVMDCFHDYNFTLVQKN